MTSNCIELQTSALLFASHDILKANLANKCPDSLVGAEYPPPAILEPLDNLFRMAGGVRFKRIEPTPKTRLLGLQREAPFWGRAGASQGA